MTETKVQPKLLRALGRWDLTGLMINSTIGAGILGLPGKLFALTGSWGVAVCIVAGLQMVLVASCFAEAGSRFQRTGGIYVCAGAAFGPRVGFLTGWLALLASLFSFAAVANLAATYAAALVPAWATGTGRAIFVSLATLLLAVPIWCGVKLSAVMHNVFSSTKLMLLALFCACALPALVSHGIPATALPPFGHLTQAQILLLFALGGMEGTIISNGEMRAPTRDLPFGLLTGMAITVAVYCLVLLSADASVPNVASTNKPVYDGIVRALGPGAGPLVVTGAVVSIIGVMFVILFAIPRSLFAMAAERDMPAIFASVHPRWHTPHYAILATTLVGLVLALCFDFVGAVSLSVVVRLIVYTIVALAATVLRRRCYSETNGPFVLPFGTARTALVLITNASILSQVGHVELVTLASALLAGGALLVAIERSK